MGSGFLLKVCTNDAVKSSTSFFFVRVLCLGSFEDERLASFESDSGGFFRWFLFRSVRVLGAPKHLVSRGL